MEGSVRQCSVIGRGVLLLSFLLSGCGASETTEEPPDGPQAPSDDPADYTVDSSVSYEAVLTEPQWLIPSDLLPTGVEPMAANNNVDIVYHKDRLHLGWRTAPTHFASQETQMILISSADGGLTWDLEYTIALGADVREPRYLSFNGTLHFLFFEGGTNPLAFEPHAIWRMKRTGLGEWTPLEKTSDGTEVPWDIKVRNGKAYMTSYVGDHYGEDAVLDVLFKESVDGETWTLVDDQPYVYRGGVSEVAFEFDADGALWAVTRNEDGDASGAGSHVCSAPADALGTWDCGSESDPDRYDSPEMFRHGDTIFLAARRDIDGPFGPEGDLVTYSLRPKRSALYRIDREARAVVHIMDIPSVGDTAFPSVRRTGAHTFTLANYTSPLDAPDIAWLEGQASAKGTQIYWLELRFESVD